MTKLFPLSLLLYSLFRVTVSTCSAQDLKLGGSVRAYGFFGIERHQADKRRHAELLLLRLTQEGTLGGHITFEVHEIVSFLSPPFAETSRIAFAGSRKFLELDRDFVSNTGLVLSGSVDRLNLSIDYSNVRVTMGRQAVTWGVSYFWPALDLFAPFAPQQIDREYKAGVDALRVTVPLGAFSEVEVIGASLGPSVDRDGAVGALVRVKRGPADLGLMGGRFHGDSVAGAFVSADVRGTGLRAEVAWAQSDDPADLARNRAVFWRGSLGVDRQLTPSVSLVFEQAWNGFGSSSPSRYLRFLQADRVLRGEVNALAQLYSGTNVTWLIHPLLTLNQSLLFNWNDRSSLWIPAFHWSTGNNSDVFFGVQVGTGRKPDRSEVLRSEFGSVPFTLFGAARIYF